MAKAIPTTARSGSRYFRIIQCSSYTQLMDDVRDPAVIHHGNTISERKDAGIVCHDDEHPTGVEGAGPEQFDHLVPSIRAEGAGRLVADNQLRVMHQCTSNSHTLLLAAGQLGRQRLRTLAEADAVEGFLRPGKCLVTPNAVNEQGDGDIFRRRQCWQEVKGLKHKTDVLTAIPGPVSLAQMIDILTKDQTLAVVLIEDAGDDRNQRSLPTP